MIVPEGEITSTATDAVGSRWMLCAVTEHDSTTDTTGVEQLAWIDLQTDGRAIAFDGVNAINASYELTPTGFAARGGATTLAAYVGDDPVRLVIIRAFAAVFDCSLSPQAAPTQVSARMIARSLELSVPQSTLTLRRVGPAAS